MLGSGFVDHYEQLQFSPDAEAETINRAYNTLATRYRPGDAEAGDLSRFLLLNTAAEKGLLVSDENSDFVIVGPGVDDLETHLPSDRLLCRLPKAAESAGTAASVREESAGSEDGS